MWKLTLGLACAAVFAGNMMADPVTLSYSTTGVVLTYLFPDGGGDTFTLNGQSGTLALDSSLTTTNTINSGTYNTVYTNGTGVKNFNLSYDLTLDGVTQTVTQAATWTITLTHDTFITVNSSAPVLFNTAAGNWDVTLQGFSIDNGAVAGNVPITANAQFSPVPEPATAGVFGAILVGLVALGRRRVLPNPAR